MPTVLLGVIMLIDIDLILPRKAVTRMRSLLMLLLGVSLSGPLYSADEPVLSIGDPLPPMAIEHFIQGEELKSLDKNRIYVLEFWATW
ncbi:MAG: hypothetical protein OSB09_08745 [Planctomycetota bacterium]|nr:hypothetical protein [Planctomycetota bacterium]